MTYFALKIIAIICMLFDHIGYFFGIFPFRIIGRLAFPIFAFLVSNGLKYTRNVKKYVLRMAVFALISELFYDISFGSAISIKSLDNVFFTLLFGLLFLIGFDWLKKRFSEKIFLAYILSIPLLAVVFAVSCISSCDYGYIGVFTVIVFGIFDSSTAKGKIGITLGIILFSGWRIWTYFAYRIFSSAGIDVFAFPYSGFFFTKAFPSRWTLCQLIRIAALVPIFPYNGKSGQPKSKKLSAVFKYGFYLFYPLHIILLYLLSNI